MASFTEFIKANEAPYGASKIGVYNSSGVRVGEVPLSTFKPSYGERLYRFGWLSDVHNETSQATENAEDFVNALKQFAEKESVEFICITGDLTQTSYSTGTLATEMALYQQNLADAGVNKTVYVTTGNHDCPNSTDVDYTTFYQYAGLSDIAPSSDATCSYEVTKTHTTAAGTTVTDHFLFLTMRRYEFTTSTYYDDDITWLGNKLEEYKNDRCFVMTHMFFPTYAGNFKQIYPSGNWLSGAQLTSLKNLIDSYPRTYWFSGHSHWKWYLQKYEDHANVYPVSNDNRTCGWALHCPSCAYPIDSDGSSTRVAMSAQSEGGVVDVYENYVDVRGIEFKGANDTDYNFKYIPVAQYRLYTDTGSTPVETTYSITLNLTNTTSSNLDSTVISGSSYVTNISMQAGYALNSITVTMGGTDITSTAVAGTHISIPSVTGNIVVTAIAAAASYTITYDLGESTCSNSSAGANAGDSYSATITHNTGYKVTACTVTMGGTDITSTVVTTSTTISDRTITIDNVTGNIVITVETEAAYDTLVVVLSAVSSGLGVMVPNSGYTYVKYDGIKIQLSGTSLTDITDEITSNGAATSNSYKIGAYNQNSVYQYVPAGDTLTCTVNTNTGSTTGFQIPIVQASSSSSVASNPIFVQLKGIKYSNNQVDWIEVNEGSTLLNGSSWGKTNVSYTWTSDITDDPTTLTFS